MWYSLLPGMIRMAAAPLLLHTARTGRHLVHYKMQLTCSKNHPYVYCYLLMVEFNKKGTYSILVSKSLAAAAWICNGKLSLACKKYSTVQETSQFVLTIILMQSHHRMHDHDFWKYVWVNWKYNVAKFKSETHSSTHRWMCNCFMSDELSCTYSSYSIGYWQKIHYNLPQLTSGSMTSRFCNLEGCEG